MPLKPCTPLSDLLLMITLGVLCSFAIHYTPLHRVFS